jgi:hypothetical protein
MRFLILNTDFSEFLHWLYAQHPGLEKKSYEEQKQAMVKSQFGIAGFYSSNLQKLGHRALDIHVNNWFMQMAWAKEHGMHLEQQMPVVEEWKNVMQRLRRTAARTPLRHLRPIFSPMLRRMGILEPSLYTVLAKQIEYYKPDIVLNQAMGNISSRFLRGMKPHVQLMVGQHAATQLPESGNWGCYDLVISSFPPTINWFRRKGISAEMSRLGFEPGVLQRLTRRNSTFDITFIGSFHKIYSSRIALLETLCDKFEQMRLWGPSIDHLSSNSPVRRCYVNKAWGVEMYQILYSSKIIFNHHGDIPPYANNLRLFEATGVGTLLITDWKENLHEMFEPGREVVTYQNAEECVELIRYYLDHEEERKAVARAGQKRTLSDHTYYQRMQELVEIVREYI